MKRIILILCVLLCAGFGINFDLCSGVSDSIPKYEIRTCQVVECYPDEEDANTQWVYVIVCGGRYDGHVYEIKEPMKKIFYAYQDLGLIFDTGRTYDPEDDEPDPDKVLKPNMV